MNNPRNVILLGYLLRRSGPKNQIFHRRANSVKKAKRIRPCAARSRICNWSGKLEPELRFGPARIVLAPDPATAQNFHGLALFTR